MNALTLPEPEAIAISDQLRATAELIATADAEVAADARQRAHEARELLRVRKAAREYRKLALHVECLALARLHVLGELTYKEAEWGEWLAGLSGDELRERVWAPDTGTPSQMYGHWCREQEAKRAKEDFEDGLVGADSESYRPVRHALEPYVASRLLEYVNSDASQAVTVQQIAVDVLRDLTEGKRSKVTTKAALEGIAHAVRDAMAAAEPQASKGERQNFDRVYHDADGDRLSIPSWVTYYDETAGWLRVPWRAARMGHLRAMARLRRKQAEEVRLAAEQLERLTAALSEYGDDQPAQYALDHLWWLDRQHTHTEPQQSEYVEAHG